MLERMRFKAGVFAICLALAGAYACGDDSSGGGDGTNNPDSSSFDVQVSADSGNENLEASQDDSQAGQSSWGATIAGPSLHLTLMTSDGTTMSAVVITSETAKAPGEFTAGDLSSGTFISLTSAMAGNTFNSTGTGTITLENCPRTVGEHVKGSFNGVVLEGQAGGNATKTLDGSFDVVVYAKAGDLFCNESSGNNDPSDNNDTSDNNDPQVCRADLCVEGGACCPYIDCVNSCQLQCITSAECAGGTNPAACAACASGCLDSCNVSAECRTAYVDLNTCNEANSCGANPDTEEQCLKDNCCSELNAAM